MPKRRVGAVSIHWLVLPVVVGWTAANVLGAIGLGPLAAEHTGDGVGSGRTRFLIDEKKQPEAASVQHKATTAAHGSSSST
jgi:hypothetical protein